MSLAPAAFVLGSPRSGTTLLRVMLAGHPGLFSPPEMVIAPFETMAERKAAMDKRFWEKGGLRRAWMDLFGVGIEEARAAVAALTDRTVPEVYASLQQALGSRMLVDKCPHLGAIDGPLQRLERWFDQPRYLWIVRNPASVTRSIQNMPMAEVMLQGFSDEPREIWRVSNARIGDFLATVPRERWAMVRYEELVADPRPVMEAACAALGVPFHEAVLDPYEGDRMREGPKGARAIGDPNLAGRGRIQPELADKWLKSFDHRTASAATKALALELGYDLEAIPLPPMAAVTNQLDALWRAAREAEASIDLPMEIDAVEGRRFLLRMVRASLETMVEENDPDRPAFGHSEGPTRKMFADCPDTDYLRAAVDTSDGRTYRVWGQIPPETTYSGILLYRRGGRIGNRLVDEAFGVDEDGRFELRVSTEPQPGTWLRADGDETAIMVRQYFGDRRVEAPLQVHIALVGEPGPPPPLTPDALGKGIERSRRMFQAIFQRTYAAYQMSQAALLNFIEVGGEDLFPTPDNRYQICWYRFGWNQLMVVRGRLPKARYFSFTLYNVWLESYDYLHRPVHRNHTRITTDADGRFELVLAHTDPGHPNWLDTAGHEAGYLVARSLLPEGPSEPFEVQVMYTSERQD